MGLVSAWPGPGYSYKLHFKWSIEDEQLGAFDSVILTSTSSYVVRKPLRKKLKNSKSGKNQNGTSEFDLIAHSRKLRMHVVVWDLYEGLTVEEALIGARHMDSAVNKVRVHCTVFESGDGRVPSGWKTRSLKKINFFNWELPVQTPKP